jgi:hypothetical protein
MRNISFARGVNEMLTFVIFSHKAYQTVCNLQHTSLHFIEIHAMRKKTPAERAGVCSCEQGLIS